MTSPTKTQIQNYPIFLKSKEQVFPHLWRVWTALCLNLLASYGRICWHRFVSKFRRTRALEGPMNMVIRQRAICHPLICFHQSFKSAGVVEYFLCHLSPAEITDL